MRTHADHRELFGWVRPEVVAPLLRADALAALRFEPVARGGRASIAVDLVLASGDAFAVVPLVFADPVAVWRRTAPPLIWPAVLDAPPTAALEALETRIVEHLEDATIGRDLRDETIVVIDPGVRDRFEAARADGALGAAPLRTALATLAPYGRALRHARERRVVLRTVDGAHGAALLRAVTATIALDETLLRDARTPAWYGLAVEAYAPARAYEVALVDGERSADAPVVLRIDAPHGVPIVVPAPVETVFSDDPDDGPARRRLAVESTPEPALRSQPAARPSSGGSAGRVLLLVRPDASAAPDADLDEAVALARELAREGLDVRIEADPAAIETFAPDVLHVIGLERPALARDAIERAARRGVPAIVSPLWDGPDDEGRWGSLASQAAFAAALDEGRRDAAAAMLAGRRVAADGAGAATPYAVPWAGEPDLRAALRGAAAVLAQSSREAARLRERFDVDAAVSGAVALFGARPAPIGALTGTDPFALAHAPVRPESNLLAVAAGAGRLGYRLVVAGPVVDRPYAARLRAAGGPGTILIPEPDAAEAAALYAAARVVVDVAWLGRGEHRLALARSAGAAVVVARHRWDEEDGVRTVDRADAAAIAGRIGDLWYAPGTPPPAAPDGSAAFRAIVQTYAGAAVPVAGG